MQNFLVEETPGKVMGFLGTAVFSMAMLFAVSASNASFSGQEHALPNPFAPERVVSAIDNLAASYSLALLDFTAPARQAVAFHMEEIKWVYAQAGDGLGLNSSHDQQVAGTSIAKREPSFTVRGSYESLNVDQLYSLLIGD